MLNLLLPNVVPLHNTDFSKSPPGFGNIAPRPNFLDEARIGNPHLTTFGGNVTPTPSNETIEQNEYEGILYITNLIL